MSDDRWNNYKSTSGNGQNVSGERGVRDKDYQEYLRLRERPGSSRRSSQDDQIKNDDFFGAYYTSGPDGRRRSGRYNQSGESAGYSRVSDSGQYGRTGNGTVNQRSSYDSSRGRNYTSYTSAGNSETYGRNRGSEEDERRRAREEYLSYRENREKTQKGIAQPGMVNKADEDDITGLNKKAAKKAAKKAKKQQKNGNGGGGRKKRRGLKIALIILLVLVIGAGAALAASYTAVKSTLDNVGRVELDPDEIGIDPDVDEELKDYRNIAILGIDARDMSSDEDVRSDAIVIASINKNTDEIKLFSVYRDTLLDMGDDIGIDKITHGYYYGGPTKVLYVLNKNLDLNIKEVVVVNWKSVADTVDALGGLDIEIQESEINEMNKYIEDTYSNIGGSNEKITSAGMQTLNGNQAVTYARIRKDAVTGDFRRNERMKIVVKATFEKAKTMKIKTLKKISSEILPEIKTNMSSADMMGMVLKLTSYEMTDSVGWPYEHNDWTSNAYYNVAVTLESNVIQLHEEFFAQEDYTPTQNVLDISEYISAVTGYY